MVCVCRSVPRLSFMRLGELCLVDILLGLIGMGVSSLEEEELSRLNTSLLDFPERGEMVSSMCIVFTPPETKVVVVVTT